MRPTTLFLPGANGLRSFWREVARRRTNLGHALFFAWPGFGDEPADPSIGSLDDLFRWFVARIPPGPVDVVAQSMGGVLAMRLALEHPERVRRLVLVATSGGSPIARAGHDWRAAFRAERSEVPDWFERDRTDLDDRLARVTAPTLLVFGDRDPIAPVSIGEHLAKRLPRARLVVIAQGTHALAVDQPDEVATAIGEFLEEG